MPIKEMSRGKGLRASKPKVRTGCSTCKGRRIKCDETRPACMRCTRFGRKCGGYGGDRPPEEQTPVASPSDRTLVPRCVTAGPSTKLFENEEEFASFHYYCDETVKHLAGAFQLPIFSRIVLQASHDQAFIRHAVIAIGSLSNRAKSIHGSGSQCLSPLSPSGELVCQDGPRMAEDIVLEHYSKFINGSMKALTSGQHGRRMALIVCLLIICVEGLQWHHGSVLRHLASGMDLLNEWLFRESKTQGVLPGISSPEPDVVEDEIVQQFRMLELEASVLYNAKPREYHERLRRDGNDTVNQMPETFSDSNEARHFLELIMQRSHHFLGTVVPQKPDLLSHPYSESQTFHIGFNTFQTLNGAMSPLQFEQQMYDTENYRWNLAFDELFRSRKPEHDDFLSTQLLKIRSRVLSILLAGELSTTELIYDNFLPHFQEIVKLARLFFQHPSSEQIIPAGSFSSNAGLIYPLRVVANKCRDCRVRREAISLLRSKSWRESSWWSVSTAQIGEWLMEIEEEGIEGEFVPEWARTRVLEMESTDDERVRRVSVKCAQGIGPQARVLEAEWSWRPPRECGEGGRSSEGTPASNEGSASF